MLRKLLKYDLKNMLRLWWIAAAVALVLSFAGAACIRILTSDRPIPEIIDVVAVLTLVVVILSWVAFAILSMIITYGRYYKNFFTDEGYLTFTLPVTRGQLLSSKLISMILVNMLSSLVIYLCAFVMLSLGIEDFFVELGKVLPELFEDLMEVIREEKIGGWLILYLVEFLIIGLLGSIFGTLFTTCCITFGCIVAKKAKLAASIGVYFGANWLFSGAMQIFYMFGIGSLATWLDGVQFSDTNINCLMMAMLIFCGVAIMGLACSLLYTLQYWMLDRKLNLP